MLKKEDFFQQFHIEDAFKKSGLQWDNLSNVYDDYKDNRYDDLQSLTKEIVDLLEKDKPKAIRAMYGRAKEPEHLIEKIIRKIGIEDIAKYKEISVDNYVNVITDLIGIRILVLTKEEWKVVDSHIRKTFHNEFIEPPKAYICYGDREIFDGKIMDIEYTNKGYRSQHYIISQKGYPIEIQVRTLAEEVYGEFDHRARYPYRQQNKFLIRYSKIVSKSVTELDDLISTCLDINEEMIDNLDKDFKQDNYVDWSKLSLPHNMNNVDLKGNNNYAHVKGAKELAISKVLRKGE